MSVGTWLATSTGETPDATWYSRCFSMVLLARPGASERPLPRDLAEALEPLTRIVQSEEEPLEDFMARDPTEERRAWWEREHGRREPAWQSPAIVLAAADAMLRALRTDPTPLLSCGIVGVDHFTASEFDSELEGLRRVLQWAIVRGIPRVRLELR